MSRRLIGLIDCNNFFVSCERLFRPDLRRTPVVVLSSNDGCVVARSQEIKDKGIPMGAPHFQVKDMLSDMGAVVFSSHFALYRDISRRVFSVVAREVGQIEQYSIDEAFFTVEESEAEELAERLRRVIHTEVGIPVSVGLGLSRTQAKYANALAKKTTGVCLLTPALWEDRSDQITLSELWGVGAARTREFSGHGLKTVADYLALSRATVRQLFGVEGERLLAELRGEVGTVLTYQAPLQKTIMSTRSFAKETSDQAVVREALLHHLHEIVAELHRKRGVATRVRILAYPSRFGDYALQGLSVEVALTAPTNDIFTLEHEVVGLLTENFKPGVPYKKAGVVVAVAAESGRSLTLFPSREEEKTAALTKVLFEINGRQGRDAIKLGTISTRQTAWRSRTDALSPNYTTDWKSLRTVKA